MSDSLPKSRYLRRTTCVKCLNIGNTVLNGKDVYCVTCFDDYCAHKFRSAFGKHKIFKGDMERVLIAVSGGPVSSGMLFDLVRRSCDETAHKRLRIQPEILHIIESTETAMANLNWIDSISKSGTMAHFIHFGSIFDENPIDGMVTVNLRLDFPNFDIDRNSPCLIKLLQSFGNSTSLLDFYRRVRTWLLIQCARKLAIRYVIIGETCSALSSRVISNVTQGRGGQTRDDVNVLDSRWCTINNDDGGVRIVRPLREFQNREMAYYNHFRHQYQNIQFSYFKPPSFDRSPSLQSAANDFVEDLQGQFPATVSTLFSSASKLFSSCNTTKKNNNQNEPDTIERNPCRFCSSPVDQPDESDFELVKGFCYGCSLMLSDVKDKTLLPRCLQ